MVTPELKWPMTNFHAVGGKLVGDGDAFLQVGAVVADRRR